MKDNKYGYKVCYRQRGKHKYKIHLICNTYDGCVWHIQYYETHDLIDSKTKRIIKDIDWLIKPVKTFIEYKWLWRGCPF